jgi:trehalose 6-phosphate synthase
VTRHGKSTLVRSFPISIDADAHEAIAASTAVDDLMSAWRHRLGLKDEFLGIGIDRLDYTKGIPDRLLALDSFFEQYPEYRRRVVFVQIGVLSRSHLPQYQSLEDEVDGHVERLNWKWESGSWRPIVLLKKHFDAPELMALHRLAHFCFVSSLHDGMNLVAKEYVASRLDNDGVLILSQFTGSARELTDALLVNPFDVEQMSQAIHQALQMPQAERQRRMCKMRRCVQENNIYRWVGKILSALLRFEPSEQAASYATASHDEAAA